MRFGKLSPFSVNAENSVVDKGRASWDSNLRLQNNSMFPIEIPMEATLYYLGVAGSRIPSLIMYRPGRFPQSNVKSTDGPQKKIQKICECNLTEFWILLYWREVGGALIRGIDC